MNKISQDMVYTDSHIELNSVVKTFVLFTQTSREVLKYVDTCLRKGGGLSLVQYITLMVLRNKSGTMRPSEIARWTQTERHNITTLLRRMERDNLIKVRRDAHDKRYVNVTITEKGQETLAKCIKVAEKFIDEIMDSFTEDNLSSFSSQLHLMMTNTRSGSDAVTRDHKRGIHRLKKKYTIRHMPRS